MALAAFIPLDHLPQGNTQGGTEAGGYGLAQLGMGTVASTGAGAQYSKTTIYVAKSTIGALETGIYMWGLGNVNSGNCTLSFPSSQLTNGTSDTSYIGFRFKPSGYGPGQTSTYPTVCFVAGLAYRIADLGLVVSATSDYYLEFVVDRVNNKVTPYVDGKPLASRAFTAGAYSGDNVGFVIGSAIGNNSYQTFTYHFSSFYFVDDTKDDSPCSRLGPCSLVAGALQTATGEDYTTTDGSSLAAVLNSPLNSAAALLNPLINTPVSMKPMDMTFNTALDQYAQIKAVAFFVSLKKNPATDTAFKLSMKMGGSTVQGPLLSFADNNLKYTASLGVQNKAPDGTAWTPAKLAATTVSVVPTNLTA